jgi:hypothetical protein
MEGKHTQNVAKEEWRGCACEFSLLIPKGKNTHDQHTSHA